MRNTWKVSHWYEMSVSIDLIYVLCPLWNCFLQHNLNFPHNTTISSLLNCAIFILADSFMSFILDPGFMKPYTLYSLFNCSFTSDAHPLAWLSPKINTLCTIGTKLQLLHYIFRCSCFLVFNCLLFWCLIRVL